MLTRKQMNLLLQQAIRSLAYDFWIRAKKEGAAWPEERITRLVVACFKKPTHVWTSGFRDIVDQVGKERAPLDTRLMPTCVSWRSRPISTSFRWQTNAPTPH
jgi:hypothetical protein|nr:MAG TPA: hypothetical protein [Caudoviricetes sp.]